ncbi:peroxidase-related enzyme [Saccharophagus degradans]|uniref:carboxymuconolactone decarboxylase family protein n=1 Tax=Saccharophagus degradans TaxID=86304 RepID=UPI001C097382|nr:peroxidase-related enzyme [Saccharophagus degradans]MBU2986277.1 peroxidase-related enzyme [Saccharophagus degradans]WGO99133.1 peroxidase-related enzyme [Saccharophagus degradans]
MSRINTPQTIQEAPKASQSILETVNQQLGSVPNLFRITSNSPHTLEGYIALNSALAKGTLPAATRERIALAVAEINGCDYCLAAHNYLGRNLAKLSSEEINVNRRGSSLDAKAAAAVEFAATIVKQRGRTSKADFEAVRAAGYSDAQIIEIVGHTALNTLTNYLNETLKTVIDFPAVAPLGAS